MDSIDAFLKNVPTINESTNYWFFRTLGGRLYSVFLDKSIIALGYAKITKKETDELIMGQFNERKNNLIKNKYPKHNRPGLIIKHLKRFYQDMKIGDFIIIPEMGGRYLAVGKIDSDVEYIEGIERVKKDGKKYIDDEFRRSRKVKWITTARRGIYHPELYGLLCTHQTMSNANRYAEWIDTLLFDFYKKGEKYHYVVNVNQQYGISAKSVYWTFYQLLVLTDDFLRKESINETTDDIDTKINLRSPGYIEFLGIAGHAIATLCIFILLINGGGFKIQMKNDFTLDLNTKGIIKRINEFLNSKQDREIKEVLIGKVRNLDIKKSSDIVDIINSINQKNQNETEN
jgi:hypothetical protein